MSECKKARSAKPFLYWIAVTIMFAAFIAEVAYPASGASEQPAIAAVNASVSLPGDAVTNPS